MKKSTATEPLRVASEVAAIRAALYKRGYRIRKQPKQPIWKVFVSPDHFYLLTYQPAPISGSYFPRDVENVSPCRREALNSPPSIIGKGVGGLGLPCLFTWREKSAQCLGTSPAKQRHSTPQHQNHHSTGIKKAARSSH